MVGDSICSEKWVDGFEGKKWIDTEIKNYSQIKIDPEHKMTELFRLNNNIRTSGIFPKRDPIRPQFLYTVDDPDKHSIIYLPAFDWNKTDGFMVGVALHNGTLLPKTIEYFAMPFYSIRNQGITGYGKVSLNVIPYNKFIRRASFLMEASQFGAPGDQKYHSLKVGSDLYFKLKDQTLLVNQKVFGYYISASDLNQILLLQETGRRSYLQLGYLMENTGIINPFNLLFSFEAGKSYQKTSLELNYKQSYNGKGNGLDIRIFAGTMLENASYPIYSFASSGRGGREQYLFAGVYPDRFGEFPKTFFSRQMAMSEGGLVTPVNDSIGYSGWVCSLSISSTLPGIASKIPVKPFATLLINNSTFSENIKSRLLFEAGFKAGVWNLFEIYIPVLVSDNLSSINGALKNRVRFVFRLDKLFPLRK
jgi:hypothetical protein